MKDSSDILNQGLCPKCGSHLITVTTTDKPYRRHKCTICGFRWQTIEVNMHRAGWLKAFIFEMALSEEAKRLPGDFQKDLLRFATRATISV